MKTKLQDGESYGSYINRRIEEIFNDLASEAGDELAKEYKDHLEDLPAGALAFELMKKSIQLQEAWNKILADGQ